MNLSLCISNISCTTAYFYSQIIPNMNEQCTESGMKQKHILKISNLTLGPPNTDQI